MSIIVGSVTGLSKIFTPQTKKTYKFTPDEEIQSLNRKVNCISVTRRCGLCHSSPCEIAIGLKNGTVEFYKIFHECNTNKVPHNGQKKNEVREFDQRVVRLFQSISLHGDSEIINISTVSLKSWLNSARGNSAESIRGKYTDYLLNEISKNENEKYDSDIGLILIIRDNGSVVVIKNSENQTSDELPRHFDAYQCSYGFKSINQTMENDLRRMPADNNSKRTTCVNFPGKKNLIFKIETEIQLPISVRVNCTAFSPSYLTQLAYTGFSQNIKIFDFITENIIWTSKNLSMSYLRLNASLCFRYISFSKLSTDNCTLEVMDDYKSTGDFLIAGNEEGRITLYDVASRRKPIFWSDVCQKKCQINCIRIIKKFENFGVDSPNNVPLCSGKKGEDLVKKHYFDVFLGDSIGKVYHIRIIKKQSIPSELKMKSCSSNISNQTKNNKYRKLSITSCISTFDDSFHPCAVDSSQYYDSQLIGCYDGVMGSVKAMDINYSEGFLAVVGYGRYLHIYDLHNRKLKQKVHLMQKLSAILCLPNTIKFDNNGILDVKDELKKNTDDTKILEKNDKESSDEMNSDLEDSSDASSNESDDFLSKKKPKKTKGLLKNTFKKKPVKIRNSISKKVGKNFSQKFPKLLDKDNKNLNYPKIKGKTQNKKFSKNSNKKSESKKYEYS